MEEAPPEVVDDLEVLLSDVLPEVFVPVDLAFVEEDFVSEAEVEPDVLLPLFDVVPEPIPVEPELVPVEADVPVPVEPIPELL